MGKIWIKRCCLSKLSKVDVPSFHLIDSLTQPAAGINKVWLQKFVGSLSKRATTSMAGMAGMASMAGMAGMG